MKNGASNVKPIPKVRRNKCDLGPDFVAPDGRWGWVILAAAGCSNVSQNHVLGNQFNIARLKHILFQFVIANQLNHSYRSRAN